jgi:hypothetical protein
MSVIRGWDQSWGFADPARAAELGFKVVAGYLSPEPSKNLTVDDIHAYHRHGIAVILNWESAPGRPLLGKLAGEIDAHQAVHQADALIADVGYRPTTKLTIYFSCDRDVSISQFGAVDAYYAATKRILGDGYGNGCYGEFDLVQHLHAKGLTVSEWQTIAWSYGKVSPEADYYQSSINDTLAGASVDFDEVRHALTLGAWWPRGLEPKYQPDHPNWSDTVDRDTVIKLAKAAAREEILDAERAVLLGGDHGVFTRAKHPKLVKDAGHGVLDRVNALEQAGGK